MYVCHVCHVCCVFYCVWYFVLLVYTTVCTHIHVCTHRVSVCVYTYTRVYCCVKKTTECTLYCGVHVYIHTCAHVCSTQYLYDWIREKIDQYRGYPPTDSNSPTPAGTMYGSKNHH